MIRVLGLAFAFALPTFADTPALKPAEYVAVQAGKLPVLISAPHGGAKDVPGARPRTGEGLTKGGAGFFAGRDTGTEELAHAIAAAVETKLGAKPYFVIARFHRKYLDANRPPEIGLEGPAARPVYDAYHDTLAKYCKAVKTEFGRGLLIDVHGQGTAKDTIFRGTQNGKTVTLLRQRFGERAHTGEQGLFGLLAANGCKVFPADGTGKEQAGFTGGHIVQKYGSHDGYGIDAMQLEFGNDYRVKAARAKTADRVAAAVAKYHELYLSKKN
jgi:N-formylglutamate amidohydrolase